MRKNDKHRHKSSLSLFVLKERKDPFLKLKPSFDISFGAAAVCEAEKREHRLSRVQDTCTELGLGLGLGGG